MKNEVKLNRTCNYCKRNPGADPRNKNLWNGFFDGDTGQRVCWNCRDRHYYIKSNGTGETTYTEFPMSLNYPVPFEISRKKFKGKRKK